MIFYLLIGYLSVRKDTLMSKNIKGNGRHLTMSDRVYIEQELLLRSSFRSIASALGKDPSTISKEIKLHSTVAPNGSYKTPRCVHCNNFRKCKDTVMLCGTCRSFCWGCSTGLKLARDCNDYNPFSCPKLYWVVTPIKKPETLKFRAFLRGASRMNSDSKRIISLRSRLR